MDINDLFQMLAEEKAKNKAEDSKKKEKSRSRKGDFLEAFSTELKNLREEEEQHKRDVAAMEAWLTSPVKEKDEPSIIEEVIESVEEVEEEKEVLEELADTPLQEEAVKYLHTKREELTEEQIKIKSLEKQFEDLRKQITSVRLGMQGQGGGGAVNIRDMDDIDRSTALVNNKFLKYNSATGTFVGADASGGGGADLSSVDENILPSATETYNLGSSSLRWNDLFLAGETIDLGGTKISKDSSGDVSFKDGSDNLKKVIVDELHIGSGSNVLKLKSSGGKLRAEDNANAKASHDITFSELSSTPTTLSGYGITDAQSALVSGTSIKTVNGTSLLGSGNISISGGGGDEAAILDNSGTPELASGITAAEIRTLIGAGTSSFDGAYSSLSGLPTISNDFTDSDHSKLDGIEASADVTDTANVTAAGALMDSEITNLSQVKAFDSSDYATAAQGTLAASALQSVSESDVTQHQAALSITESQISDLGSYITNSVTNTSTDAIMTFTTTEASSTAGPVIDLKRNSASPADGDYLGQLKFRGENDADQDVIYAKLTGKISDASDGTEDGLIEITVKNGGSNRIVARFTGNELKLLNNAGIDVASGGTIDGELASTATATTASTGDDSTKIATTAFVQQEITALKALLYAYDQS